MTNKNIEKKITEIEEQIVIRINAPGIEAHYYEDGSGQIELFDTKNNDAMIYFADCDGLACQIREMKDSVKTMQRHIKVYQKAIDKLQKAKKRASI